MHYTGIAAIWVHLTSDVGVVRGADINWFLVPIVIFVPIVVVA